MSDELPEVDPLCKVVVDFRGSDEKEWVYCDKPTTHWYPSMGGGTQSLCEEHAQRHLPNHAWPIGTPSPWSG